MVWHVASALCQWLLLVKKQSMQIYGGREYIGLCCSHPFKDYSLLKPHLLMLENCKEGVGHWGNRTMCFCPGMEDRLFQILELSVVNDQSSGRCFVLGH